MKRVLVLMMLVSSFNVMADRPAASGHAPSELFATESGVDGPTPGSRYLATLPNDTREALRKEGRAVLSGKEQGQIRAVIRFERPIDQVFASITQPSQMSKYLPHVDQSTTVGARSEEGEVVDVAVSVLFASFKYRVQHWYYPEQHRMEWTLDKSIKSDFVEQVGFWQLYALDEKTTIAEYGIRVQAKDGFIELLRGIGERGGVADALTAIRRHVHSPR